MNQIPLLENAGAELHETQKGINYLLKLTIGTYFRYLASSQGYKGETKSVILGTP